MLIKQTERGQNSRLLQPFTNGFIYPNRARYRARWNCLANENRQLKGTAASTAEDERGYVEALVRIANRHGYQLRCRVSDRHRVMRHKDTGEELEIELLEVS
jgi:hypothetical protein